VPKRKEFVMQESTTRILVVDDDLDIRQLIPTVLKSSGYACVTAGNAAEGLERFTQDISLVITDLNMPSDGISLIKSLREISQVPIIILTAYRKKYVQELDQIGYIAWLTKPIEFKSLLDLVKLELGRNAGRPELARR
jgi:DNA-binding response OmpR family regulator